MNARLGMLLLVAALFAAAWTSDQNHRNATDRHNVVRLEYLRSLENQRALASVGHGSRQRSGIARRPSEFAKQNRWTVTRRTVANTPTESSTTPAASTVTLRQVHSATGRLVQLPIDITAGHYRVVDTAGIVDSLIVPGVVTRTANNLFQQSERGQLTYFIRIDDRVATTAARKASVESAIQ